MDLSLDYPHQQGVLRRAALEVFPGEFVGLVGQSGSGKTSLALAILKLLDHSGARVRGRVQIAGTDVSSWNERQMRDIRGRLIALVPQSPSSALNPMLRLETHLREAWKAHSREPWHTQAERVQALFQSAGLPSDPGFRRRFPGQISLGQGQRLLVVMALLHSPRVLLADELTSSLDVITQMEVLVMLRTIRDAHGLGGLFISHDLAAVAMVCDRVAVLSEGRIVENGPVENVLQAPQHAYTRRLVDAAARWR